MFAFNVTEYGAIGDGLANDTLAIQRTIDQCSERGGGTVFVPAGTYLVGTLFMRDHITLHLDPGARLCLSTDRSDFFFPALYEGKFTGVSFPAMIYGKNVSNVTISGQGVFEGQEEQFWTPLEKIDEDTPGMSVKFWGNEKCSPDGWRPMMVLFEGCKDVTICNVTFERSPCYAVWLIECERGRLQGLTVNHHFHGPNTDGFHLSSCRFITISECDFHTGDDSIAIDGDGNGPAEHITIMNCHFRSLNNMCRLFTGIDPWHNQEYEQDVEAVRHIAISNCTVYNAAGGLNIVAKNGTIEYVTVSNLTLRMELPGVPIFMMADQGTIRNISIHHVVAEANGVCTISGKPGDVIEGIRISESHFDIKPIYKRFGLSLPDPIPSYPAYHHAPYGIYLRHAQDVVLRNISINWQSELPENSCSALTAFDLDRLEISGFFAEKCGSDAETAVISLKDVRKVNIDGCRTSDETDLYIIAEEMNADNIHLGYNNDFDRTPVSVLLDSEKGLSRICYKMG